MFDWLFGKKPASKTRGPATAAFPYPLETVTGERVAIRPLERDGQYGVFFASHRIAGIDLTRKQNVGHVSEQMSAISPD